MSERTTNNVACSCSRRRLLQGLAGAALLPSMAGVADAADGNTHPSPNGGTAPYPIPWLDKNGSHNQPAGPGLEPSHIFHYKGLVARTSTFTGMGTDNAGNRIAFGSPTTDYGVMSGEYWAARTAQHGNFTHI